MNPGRRDWFPALVLITPFVVIYLVLFIYGLVIDHGKDINFVPVNDADNWLHLVLGLGMVALGLALGREAHDRTHDRV